MSLITTEEPTEYVRLEQPNVSVSWEGQNFGPGILYITERVFVWISDNNKQGFTLTYPSIGVYGIASPDAQFPEQGLFMVVDLNLTSVPHPSSCNGDGDGESDDNVEEDGSRTATIRLTPENPACLNLITNLMQECQLLNPTEEENVHDDIDYDFDPDTSIDLSGPIEVQDEWFVAGTGADEIQLSDEGRANLERIVGNMNLNTEGSDEHHGDDEPMEDE